MLADLCGAIDCHVVTVPGCCLEQNAGGVISMVFQVKLGLTDFTFCMPMGSVVVNSAIFQVDPSHHQIGQ